MLKRLTEFLDKNSVKYVVMSHSAAYTATEVAAIAHLPGKELAKTVMTRVDGKMNMIVLPASSMVDFGELRKDLNASKVELATEADFKELFPECEVGAMPPFGNLFAMDVIVERTLADTHEIAFNAGNHKELIRMSYADFERLVRPKVFAFGKTRKTHEDEADALK